MPHDERGWEVLDQTPLARPVGWKQPESLQDMIARLIRTEVSRRASDMGAESFEEADDFDVDDDPELRSPYELDDLAEEQPRWQEEPQRKAALDAAEKRLADRMKPSRSSKAETDPPVQGGSGPAGAGKP